MTARMSQDRARGIMLAVGLEPLVPPRKQPALAQPLPRRRPPGIAATVQRAAPRPRRLRRLPRPRHVGSPTHARRRRQRRHAQRGPRAQMPYPGSMKPCPCICLAAGHPVSPTLNNIKKRPGSAAMRPRPHCRSAAAHVAELARPAAPVGTRSMSQDPSGGKQCRAARHPASRTCVRTWVDGATAARRTSAQLPGRAQWPELGRRLAALHLPDLETAGRPPHLLVPNLRPRPPHPTLHPNQSIRHRQRPHPTGPDRADQTRPMMNAPACRCGHLRCGSWMTRCTAPTGTVNNHLRGTMVTSGAGWSATTPTRDCGWPPNPKPRNDSWPTTQDGQRSPTTTPDGCPTSPAWPASPDQ